MYKVTAKKKPRGWAARWRLSNALIWIAGKVKPDNPEVAAFVVKKAMDAYMETMIYGSAATCPHCMSVINPQSDTKYPTG